MFYTVSSTNAIGSSEARPDVPGDTLIFVSRQEFRDWAKHEPKERLEALDLQVTGTEPAEKFLRIAVIDRIWAGIRALTNEVESSVPFVDDAAREPEVKETEEVKTEPKKAAKKKTAKAKAKTSAKAKSTPKGKKSKATPKTQKSASAPKSKKLAETHAPRDGSKREKLIAMMSRASGATGEELQQEFGWLPHSVRGAISTLRSKGTPITTEKNSKWQTVYHAA